MTGCWHGNDCVICIYKKIELQPLFLQNMIMFKITVCLSSCEYFSEWWTSCHLRLHPTSGAAGSAPGCHLVCSGQLGNQTGSDLIASTEEEVSICSARPLFRGTKLFGSVCRGADVKVRPAVKYQFLSHLPETIFSTQPSTAEVTKTVKI